MGPGQRKESPKVSNGVYLEDLFARCRSASVLIVHKPTAALPRRYTRQQSAVRMPWSISHRS
jgi:hypothetical protein